MSDVTIGFIVAIFLSLLFGFGSFIGEGGAANSCNDFGKFKHLGTVYECKAIEEVK